MASDVQPYDFRRPDRIAKEQLRAIQILHEALARSLGSSLSAYLRAYVIVHFDAVEQVTFQSFLRELPSPTCMVTLSIAELEEKALIELGPALVFPILEMLLGGKGASAVKIEREVTEIEKGILDGLFRIVVKDLREAWRQVAAIDFGIATFETEPQLVQILAPSEAVVKVRLTLKIGDIEGRMNLAVPSIVVRMVGRRHDPLWTTRRQTSQDADQERVLRLLHPARLTLTAELRGQTVSIRDLLKLEPGDVLAFECAAGKAIDVSLNGVHKFEGQILPAGQKRAVRLTGSPP